MGKEGNHYSHGLWLDWTRIDANDLVYRGLDTVQMQMTQLGYPTEYNYKYELTKFTSNIQASNLSSGLLYIRHYNNRTTLWAMSPCYVGFHNEVKC